MKLVRLIRFGKYRGRLLDEVIHLPDPDYWGSVVTQSFFWRHFPDTLDAIWLAQGPQICETAVCEAAVIEAKQRARQ